MLSGRSLGIVLSVVLLSSVCQRAGALTRVDAVEGFYYIDTSFQNASTLNWSVDPNHTIDVYLLYDYERQSPNRAAGHWHFRLEAAPGSQWTIVLHNFDNIWNGRRGCPVSEQTTCWVSPDGEHWRVLPTDFLEGNRLRVNVTVETGSLYVARLEPYTLTDLEKLKQRLAGRDDVEITEIGKTVQGRPLEIIRVGDPDAPHSVVIRGRAHPWEPGGNWVIDGLLDRLTQDDDQARKWRRQFCVYVQPIANKDGVAMGWTRFNVRGEDLNRKWDKPSDPNLAPEKYALEQWLDKMIRDGRRPDLLLDFHNDQSGNLHVSRPPVEDLDAYLKRMADLETALRAHTWFTEGSTKASFRNPGSIGEGILQRYGIPAAVHELNADIIAGLNEPAQAKHWKTYGACLPRVFEAYFAND